MAKMLDLIEKLARGEAPPPAIATLIGFSLVAHATSTCMTLRGEAATGR